MRIIIYILFVLSIQNVYTQDILLLDIDTNMPVQFATIVNKSSSKFMFSDELGKCSFPFKTADSIVITHLSYQTKKMIVSGNSINMIHLTKKIINLDEIHIANSKSNKLILEKDYTYYGLSLDREYVVFVENFINKDNKILSEITIPIKQKEKYSTDGKLEISILSADENNVLTDNVIFGPLYLDVKTLKNQIVIEIPQNNLLNSGINYYLKIKRIVNAEVFQKNNINLSVNPFFKVFKSSQVKKIFIKEIYGSKWIEITKKNYPFVPLFDLQFHYLK